MPIYRVDVSGRLQGHLHIEAPTKDQAERIASEMPMPADERCFAGFDDFSVDSVEAEEAKIDQCACRCGCGAHVPPAKQLQLCNECLRKQENDPYRYHELTVWKPEDDET